MEIISENRQGLSTTSTLRCKMCKIIKTITTEEPNKKAEVNNLITVGSVATGIGYSQCSELFAFIDMSFMASNTYLRCTEEMAEKISSSLWASLESAAAEKSRLAVQAGDVDNDGVPFITVIVDGAWSKRSYNVTTPLLLEL